MPFRDLIKQVYQNLGLSDDESVDEQTSLELAVTCLLIEMCEADQQTDPLELVAVTHALTTQYDLAPDLVIQLIEQARHRSHSEVSFHPYVNIVNELASQDEKREILLQMWRVAYADNALDKYEEHYLRRLADLLRLSHRVFMQTKHEVMDERRSD